MNLADQFISPEDLARDFPGKSVAEILRVAIGFEIRPVIVMERNWLAAVACWLSLRSPIKQNTSLFPRAPILHVGNVKCLEVGKSDCKLLLKDGDTVVRTFDAVHVCSLNSPSLIKVMARDYVKHANNKPKENQLPIAMPCFVVFDKQSTDKAIDSRRFLEDFDSSLDIRVRIGDLRFTPDEERKLRQRLGKKPPMELTIPGESGPHISEPLAQLLQVLKEHHRSRQAADSSSIHQNSQEDTEQELHKRLLDKDKENWNSQTLRQCAIRLICPRNPTSGRSKKKEQYEPDGTPCKLAELLHLLQTKYEDLRHFDSAQYEKFLIRELSTTSTDAKRITTIIRLEQSSRGGRRKPKPQSESPSI